jgi:hypothetical protein
LKTKRRRSKGDNKFQREEENKPRMKKYAHCCTMPFFVNVVKCTQRSNDLHDFGGKFGYNLDHMIGILKKFLHSYWL